MSDLIIKDNTVTHITINGTEKLPVSILILAIGSSARDTYMLLHKRGFVLEQKPFSIGLRIEHTQEMINYAQYGKSAGHPALPPAEYKLVYHASKGRSVYSFCMCPGGYVVPASFESDHIVTNGMSFSTRDGMNANAAIVVNITPQDMKSDHPCAGIEFQRAYERKAFEIAGKNYFAPVQTVGAFMSHGRKKIESDIQPTYRPGYVWCDLHECLPDFVSDAISQAITYFDSRLKGFASPHAILTGVETITSSPLRIIRDKKCRSVYENVFPIGEGAGYAGGIVSSALDGVKLVERIMNVK